jgi:hypothetical protein
MVKFFREHLDETTFEVLKLVGIGLAVGGVLGTILGVVLNHEIAEVNAARATQEAPCP